MTGKNFADIVEEEELGEYLLGDTPQKYTRDVAPSPPAKVIVHKPSTEWAKWKLADVCDLHTVIGAEVYVVEDDLRVAA